MTKQVLVVDDSDDIHQLITALFAKESVRIHSAMDAMQGLVLADSLRPDLILLDVDMPGMNGYAFCEKLKASLLLSAIPVIFLTGQGDGTQKMKGLHLGAVDYVTKPFNPGELIARVRGALRTQSVISDMQERALFDPVTGLGNEKMLETRMRGEVSERARSPRPLTCAAVEIDDFRSFLMTHGDQFGQQALRGVATSLQETFRPEDVICRVALNLFAVMMPDTSVENAVELVHSFKQRLAMSKCKLGTTLTTLSSSVAIADARAKYDHATFTRAAKSLLASSGEGLNRLIVEPNIARLPEVSCCR